MMSMKGRVQNKSRFNVLIWLLQKFETPNIINVSNHLRRRCWKQSNEKLTKLPIITDMCTPFWFMNMYVQNKNMYSTFDQLNQSWWMCRILNSSTMNSKTTLKGRTVQFAGVVREFECWERLSPHHLFLLGEYDWVERETSDPWHSHVWRLGEDDAEIRGGTSYFSSSLFFYDFIYQLFWSISMISACGGDYYDESLSIYIAESVQHTLVWVVRASPFVRPPTPCHSPFQRTWPRTVSWSSESARPVSPAAGRSFLQLRLWIDHVTLLLIWTSLILYLHCAMWHGLNEPSVQDAPLLSGLLLNSGALPSALTVILCGWAISVIMAF